MASAITANCSLIPPGCYSQGSGNIYVDPLFCDPTNGSYYLQWGSPALAVNTNGCGLIGAFGEGGCNSVGLAPVSWGSLKARYRDSGGAGRSDRAP